MLAATNRRRQESALLEHTHHNAPSAAKPLGDREKAASTRAANAVAADTAAASHIPEDRGRHGKEAVAAARKTRDDVARTGERPEAGTQTRSQSIHGSVNNAADVNDVGHHALRRGEGSREGEPLEAEARSRSIDRNVNTVARAANGRQNALRRGGGNPGGMNYWRRGRGSRGGRARARATIEELDSAFRRSAIS